MTETFYSLSVIFFLLGLIFYGASDIDESRFEKITINGSLGAAVCFLIAGALFQV